MLAINSNNKIDYIFFDRESKIKKDSKLQKVKGITPNYFGIILSKLDIKSQRTQTLHILKHL